MRLNLFISDSISKQSYHQVIIVKNWEAAKVRAKQCARLWAAAHHGVEVGDVETRLTPTDGATK